MSLGVEQDLAEERLGATRVHGDLYLLEMDAVVGTWWGWCGGDGVVLSGGHAGAPDHVNRRLCLRAALRAIEDLHGAVEVVAKCGLRVRNSTLRRPQDHGVLLSVRQSWGDRARGRSALSSFTVAGLIEEGEGLVRAREAAWWALVEGGGLGQEVGREGGAQLSVGTDASVDPVAGIGVWCWYAQDGRYGLGVIDGGVNSSSLMETRAVAEALGSGASLRIVTDCKHFLRVLTSVGGTKSGRCGEEERDLRRRCVELLSVGGSVITWKKGHRGRGVQVHADHLSRGLLRAVVAARALVS
jgi:ribonuclease HI